MKLVIKTDITDQEINAKQIADNHGIEFKVSYVGEGRMSEDHNQVSDKFWVTITNKKTGQSHSFDYFQGVGHRKTIKRIDLSGRRLETPVSLPIPTVGSLMYCLTLDMQCGHMSFKDFCNEFGYDYDSRKHLALHSKIEVMTENLERVFCGTGTFIEEMAEALEDF